MKKKQNVVKKTKRVALVAEVQAISPLKGKRTYASFIGVIIAQTSAMLLSLGVIHTGVSTEQVQSIVQWLDTVSVGLSFLGIYFRSVANK